MKKYCMPPEPMQSGQFRLKSLKRLCPGMFRQRQALWINLLLSNDKFDSAFPSPAAHKTGAPVRKEQYSMACTGGTWPRFEKWFGITRLYPSL
jgi:hypothetical protein